ncbi:MFS transporter [Proteobacteria bacterium 005FR1]|nr:MFS transporter [Proteobacteria bacterium 005FR1]
MSASPEAGKNTRTRLPGSIWALGFVSMFMDVSSEMIHALLPVFLVSVLGASTVMVGIVEGLGEATASVTKLFSGWLSDRFGKRKFLTVLGYSLGALSKPLFAVAPSAPWVLFARFSDRVGKGIRGAPRDALVSDLAPAGLRGAAFGLRQSLDTVGAFVGPLLAIGLMALFANDFRLVFWIAVVPGLAAVAILIFGVREGGNIPRQQAARFPLRRRELQRLGSLYWGVVAVGGVLTLARFSEAFLVLRAADFGLTPALVPLVLVVMNLVYAGSAYPAGVLSDRLGRQRILAGGFVVLIAADVVLATATNLWVVMGGVALWGLHMGMTQGLLAALVAETSPANARGTAFGLFHLITGAVLLLASVIAGMLWDLLGASATFWGGAIFTGIGLIGLGIVAYRKR